jgi:hypothetical protein
VERRRMDAPRPQATTSPPWLKHGLTLYKSAETTCVLSVLVLLVLLLGVVLVVLRVVEEEAAKGRGEARLGAPLFFLFGVTAAGIFRRARGGLWRACLVLCVEWFVRQGVNKV